MILVFKQRLKSANLLYPLFVICTVLFSTSAIYGQNYMYTLDLSFNSGQLFGQYPYPDEIYDLYLHDDGRVVAAGSFEFDGNFLQGIGRVWSNGDKDESLNPYYPVQYTPEGNPYQWPYSGFPYDLEFINDSADYLVSWLNFLERISDTLVSTNDDYWNFIYSDQDLFGNLTQIYKSYVLPNNKVLVMGHIQLDTQNVDMSMMIRTQPNGDMDSSFVPLRSLYGYSADFIRYVEPLQNDKWLVSGRFTGINGWPTVNVARLNTDFSVDTTFTSPLDTASVWHDGVCQIMAIDSLNRYLINNAYFFSDEEPPLSPTDTIHLIRMLSNGAVDTTFHWKYLYSEPLHEKGHIIGGLLTENGYIIGGKFSEYNGEPRQSILEVDFDGNLLSTFADVHPETDEWINVPAVDKIRRLPNGDLYVAGRFSTFAGYFRVNLARLKRTPVGVATIKPPAVELQVYPNPAGDYLTMHYNVLFAKPQTFIEIYGSTGVLVTRFECNRMKEGIKVWDTRNITGGVYLVRFVQNGTTLETRKAVIQH